MRSVRPRRHWRSSPPGSRFRTSAAPGRRLWHSPQRRLRCSCAAPVVRGTLRASLHRRRGSRHLCSTGAALRVRRDRQNRTCVASPWALFAPLFALLALLTWRALATGNMPLYFIAAFFGLVAEAAWSAVAPDARSRARGAALYAAFARLLPRRSPDGATPSPAADASLGKRRGPHRQPRHAPVSGVRAGDRAPACGASPCCSPSSTARHLHRERRRARLPLLSAIGAGLSWLVLAVWWGNASAAVGVMPSLLVAAADHARDAGGARVVLHQARESAITGSTLRRGTYLGLWWLSLPLLRRRRTAVVDTALAAAGRAGGRDPRGQHDVARDQIERAPRRRRGHGRGRRLRVVGGVCDDMGAGDARRCGDRARPTRSRGSRISRERGAWNDAAAAAACALVIAEPHARTGVGDQHTQFLSP